MLFLSSKRLYEQKHITTDNSSQIPDRIVTRLTRRVSLVEQELVPSGAPEFTSDFQWGPCYSIFNLLKLFTNPLFCYVIY
jgi:hypothetical protein